MFRYLPLLILLICCACEGRTAARKAARGPNFVPEPNHLFFKNTRARHYNAEEVTNRATIYRHGGLFQSAANLRPALIDNWLQDRAVIRFEIAPDLPDLTDWTLKIQRRSGAEEALLLSTPPTNRELVKLMAVLNGKEALFLFSPIDTILPAFPDEAGRQHARTVIKDYLTLVDH
ncbi:hypothetical protein [Neolewinella persica]|uniref:hypothetical protein n=1 Tax=Neolewinella persica TaxID=70998 RepID=UPI0003821F57|nr:hypothetical protein [Neolewinella persica]